MRVIWLLAYKELQDGLRNRWIASSVILLGSLALALTLVGTSPVGSVKISPLETSVVSLASLSVYFIPLIALMLAFDALVGEIERGTMALLLTYPVARWQVVIGKFTGHSLIIAFAILVGYGVAAIVTLVSSENTLAGWPVYLAMMGSSLLLGMVFIALAYLGSIFVQERDTAVGIAVGIWMLFVVIYDLLLLGILLLDQNQSLSPQLFSILMLINPSDSYRILNLASFEGVAQLTGIASIGADNRYPTSLMLGILLAWILVPLMVTMRQFSRLKI